MTHTAHGRLCVGLPHISHSDRVTGSSPKSCPAYRLRATIALLGVVAATYVLSHLRKVVCIDHSHVYHGRDSFFPQTQNWQAMKNIHKTNKSNMNEHRNLYVIHACDLIPKC